MRLGVAILFTTSVVYANPRAESDIQLLRRDDLGFRARADAHLAALATTRDTDRHTGAVAQASGEVAVTGVGCDVIAAGGQLGMRSDDRILSAAQWASVCPLGEKSGGFLLFDHRLDWDVMPPLLSAPRLRPGLQRRETFGMTFSGATVRVNDPGELSLVPRPIDTVKGGRLRMEGQVGWAETDPAEEVRAVMEVEVRTFRRDYGDEYPFEVTFGTVRMDVLILWQTGPGDPLAASLALELARLEGVRVGAGFRFGARLGGRLGGLAAENPASETFELGEGGLSIEHGLIGGLVMRIGGERRAWPAWDARYVVDDRATLSLYGQRGRMRGRLDVFAARAKLLQIGADRAFKTTGLIATAELDISRHLAIKMRSELGDSFYAVGAGLDAPRFASETLVMLAARVGR